ncbi:MAG: hypothetical protein LC808_13155 [Actinobacteria bacterium]|nr:hypothetical protein [Actinomycetota bacterium]
MHLNDLVRWLGTGAKIVVPLAALATLTWILLQIRDHRRKQAARVTAEKQGHNLLVYVPGDDPITGVVAVLADELEPPAFCCVSWPRIVGGVPYSWDSSANLLALGLPLSETYFTDSRRRHWRIDAKDHSLHWVRKSPYSADPRKVDAEIGRRQPAPVRKRRLAGRRHRVRS